jgi:peptidoglycan hydrolase FlgJ
MSITGITSTSTSLVGSTATNNAEQAKLKSAAQAFEAVFLRQMIGSMRSAELSDGAFDSSATQQFRDMADGKTADGMAQKGVLGIAQLLEKQLGALPQVKALEAGADVAGRAGHVVGDLAKRLKL